MAREVLAVDIDDTVFPFTPEFLRYCNQLRDTNYALGDMTTYCFEDVLGLTPDEMTKYLKDFHSRDDLHIPPVAGSQEVISRLHTDIDFIGVTARRPELEASSLRYLQHAFDGTFTGVVAIGYTLGRTKAAVCKEKGAFALVDDSIGHLRGCVANNIGAVLFGSHPWNAGVELGPGIVRCDDWLAVERHINERG